MGAKMGGGSFDDINMTPLIDIVLVVLIIMMVNMPIEIQEMGVKLPGPKPTVPPPPPPPDAEKPLVIAVYDNGDLALNRKMMTEQVLFFEVTRRLRPMTKKNVFVDGGPEVPFGRIVDMMDLAREAGAAKVGLARLKEAGPATPTSVAPGAMPRGIIFGSPMTVGPIDEVTADKAIQAHKGKLMTCYKPALATNPDLSGRLMLRFSVGPNGEHMDEKIASSDLNNAAVEDCVRQGVLPVVTFPPLGEGKTAIVQYPVIFSPG